jgi:DHA1 family bicyclomycin/chloramphenicol resistance-like MFS transporter
MTLGAATAFPTVQLALLDCFPSRRGAAASGSTFLGLTISAVVTAVVVPVASGSLRQVALAALALMLLSGLLWAWHLIAVRRELRTPDGGRGGRARGIRPPRLRGSCYV